jgi:hypothetical protein
MHSTGQPLEVGPFQVKPPQLALLCCSTHVTLARKRQIQVGEGDCGCAASSKATPTASDTAACLPAPFRTLVCMASHTGSTCFQSKAVFWHEQARRGGSLTGRRRSGFSPLPLPCRTAFQQSLRLSNSPALSTRTMARELAALRQPESRRCFCCWRRQLPASRPPLGSPINAAAPYLPATMLPPPLPFNSQEGRC